MGVIHRLPSEVIDRIAAGEVIERPASVVKELVENAIDAGATQIEVRAEAGGLNRITVSDDGTGMTAGDARLAFERHATSKITSADDLFRIETMGFRGEALSSVAAVSRVTLTTRRAEDEEGRRLVVEGGELLADEPVGAPPGTTVDVADLFFNTPARRKFMRAPATELAHLVDGAVRCVIGASGVGLVVASGERRLLDVPSHAEPSARAAAALRQRTELYAFSGPSSVSGIRVSGFLASPERARRDAKGMWTLVNRRWVRDRTLRAAVLDAFGAILEPRRYPVCVVDLRVPPEMVDVNVHPQKQEVRFAESNPIYRAVCSALTHALAQSPWLETRGGARPVAAIEALGLATETSATYRVTGPGGRFAAVEPVVEAAAGLAPVSTEPLIVGEVGRFVLCRSARGWLVVDRPAAIERLCADRLEAEQAAGGIECRPLLFPEPLQPTSPVDGWLEANWESLSPLGFTVEPVGPGRFAVRAVPAALPADVNVRALILDVLETIVTFRGSVAARDRFLHVRCAEHASRRPLRHEALGELLVQLWQLGPDVRSLDDTLITRPLDEAELMRLFRSNG